jgi:hypothetical protein
MPARLRPDAAAWLRGSPFWMQAPHSRCLISPSPMTFGGRNQRNRTGLTGWQGVVTDASVG